MVEAPLTKEAILDAAEQVLRRFGPEKTTVLDVARVLDVSHGTVYRHFTSKASLREAVAQRWLHQVSTPLRTIAQEPGTARERLRLWFDTLRTLKSTKMREDPELFAMYSTLTSEAVEVVGVHVEELVGQLTAIIEGGIASEEFRPGDAGKIAAAIFMATVRFHNPVHARDWTSPTIDQEFDQVWNLLLSGILN